MEMKLNQPNPNVPVHPGHFKVTVNTKEKVVEKSQLTFNEVCLLAYPEGPFGDGIVYSVLYRYKHDKDDQLLDKSSSVQIREGMTFDVDNADRS
jgi:hypothetical protein